MDMKKSHILEQKDPKQMHYSIQINIHLTFVVEDICKLF